ncbi:unnamed protein product [Owenia fusiformis]|uniref:Uncharacterized protein n=1 Tax=Owenia fusiformis TaxID=6347 RepID=A0A8J1Y9H0_OWEFU|nr:unnamed protein product [Owenia fusiformis]
MAYATTTLTDVHKAVLRACRVKLEESVDVEYIMARCIQDGVISQKSKAKILSKHTRHDQCSAFLDILETRDAKAYDDFVSSLQEDYPFLKNLLEKELRSQSLLYATMSLTIANETIPNKLQPSEEQSTRTSVRNVHSLVLQLQSSLGISSDSVDTTHPSSLLNQFKDLNLSKPNLTLKQTKIEVPDFCWGMCLSPLGEIVVCNYEQGIMVYNPDLTLKLQFTVDKRWSHDVACFPTGEIIVSSRTNDCVKVYNSNGDYQSDICKQVKNPSGLAYNNNLGLIVIGGAPNTINICTNKGEIKHTITNESFENLYRVHVNPYDLTILVSDIATDTLHCFTKDGGEVFKYTGHGDDKLNEPRGIFVTKQHILLVDTLNHRVILLNHQGGYIKTLFTKEQHGLHWPGYVLVDSTGNILVWESGSGKTHLHVFKFSE